MKTDRSVPVRQAYHEALVHETDSTVQLFPNDMFDPFFRKQAVIVSPAPASPSTRDACSRPSHCSKHTSTPSLSLTLDGPLIVCACFGPYSRQRVSERDKSRGQLSRSLVRQSEADGWLDEGGRMIKVCVEFRLSE
ncbi:hypothetical protein BLNAU_11202 [Blattamonas nauphoetae]|uniref:Uncharacterized protein n=1 Tax=Blattamonas nauphoetae TaxID=2049346 RepID=A0ABQ9XS05_9EUKA|nr:hypothetical protein BLNAU_11202 [Blattamonas nauphoetae]